MANVTGWDKLLELRIFSAVVDLFMEATANWAIPLLFVVFQVLIFMKTRDITLMWISGVIFTSFYIIMSVTFDVITMQSIFVILAVEFALILFMMFFRDN